MNRFYTFSYEIMGYVCFETLAFDGDHVIGLARVRPYDVEGYDGYWFITDLWVSPDYRRQGIGLDLVRRKLAIRPDTRACVAATNADSMALFQKAGFVEDYRGEVDDKGLELIVLRRTEAATGAESAKPVLHSGAGLENGSTGLVGDF